MGRFGRIDGVVNDADIPRDMIFRKMTPKAWDALPAMTAGFTPAKRSGDVFSWDPI